MEPLSKDKIAQLAEMSSNRRRVSLPHQGFCIRKEKREEFFRSTKGLNCDEFAAGSTGQELMTGFDEMTTFENKTICLIR